MAVPRKKVSASRRGKRRSGHRDRAIVYVEDRESGDLHRPHHMVLETGVYRGRVVKEPRVRVEESEEG